MKKRLLETFIASSGVEATGSIPDYDQVARDLVAAHDEGDAAALERLRRHYRRPLAQDDVRANVWGHVYAVRQRASQEGLRRLEISEARELIAREAGFGNWTAFIEATAHGRPAPGQPYQIHRSRNMIRPRRTLTTPREWEALVDLMKEQRITSLLQLIVSSPSPAEVKESA